MNKMERVCENDRWRGKDVNSVKDSAWSKDADNVQKIQEAELEVEELKVWRLTFAERSLKSLEMTTEMEWKYKNIIERGKTPKKNLWYLDESQEEDDPLWEEFSKMEAGVPWRAPEYSGEVKNKEKKKDRRQIIRKSFFSVQKENKKSLKLPVQHLVT